MDLRLDLRRPIDDPTDWRRMGSFVFAHFMVTALAREIRQAGHSVSVHSHHDAIFATAIRANKVEGWELHHYVEWPNWWLPAKKSHGMWLVEELEEGLRIKWEDWHAEHGLARRMITPRQP